MLYHYPTKVMRLPSKSSKGKTVDKTIQHFSD